MGEAQVQPEVQPRPVEVQPSPSEHAQAPQAEVRHGSMQTEELNHSEQANQTYSEVNQDAKESHDMGVQHEEPWVDEPAPQPSVIVHETPMEVDDLQGIPKYKNNPNFTAARGREQFVQRMYKGTRGLNHFLYRPRGV